MDESLDQNAKNINKNTCCGNFEKSVSNTLEANQSSLKYELKNEENVASFSYYDMSKPSASTNSQMNPQCSSSENQQFHRTQGEAQPQGFPMKSEAQDMNQINSPVLAELPPSNLSENQSSKARTIVKKTNLTMKSRLKEAVMCCEWNMCVVSMQKMEKFLLHVAEHVAAANGPPTNDGYLCQWRNCGFVCHVKDEIDRHVYFHAFHAKIKGIGVVVMKEQNLQCTIDDQSRNMIPEIPFPFECMWDECRFQFVSAQDFYWHVQGHAIPVEKENNYFLCSWEGCKFKVPSSTRLVDHVRSHTQEKVVGCPNCGSIFAGINKFQDHCYRHVAQEMQTFECSHCKCKFATERLLREHVRRHINHFKCPHCEMTCATKFLMENHIKYRHTNNKPFKCPECTKRFKLQQDVLKHLSTHSEEPSFVCPYPECNFACRSYPTYSCHVKKVHEGARENAYVCHMCDQQFPKGYKLTRHLKNIHDYHWPAGHTRFRYSKDEDGYYKLQTTRFESIELAQELLNEEEKDLDDPDSVLDGQCTELSSQYESITEKSSREIIEPMDSNANLDEEHREEKSTGKRMKRQ